MNFHAAELRAAFCHRRKRPGPLGKRIADPSRMVRGGGGLDREPFCESGFSYRFLGLARLPAADPGVVMKRLVLICVVVGTMALAYAETCRADVPNPKQMVVTAQGAPMMRGRNTLAILPAGHHFDVLRTEGNWVGTRTRINGRAVSGWLWHQQVTTPERFAQMSRGAPAARRYSYQPGTSVRRYSYAPAIPGASTPWRGPYPYATNTLSPDSRDYITGGVRSGSPLIMGATRYGTNYWRADRKIIGY